MILTDTSAWIEYDLATRSPADLRITGLIDGGGAGGLAVTEPVVMEFPSERVGTGHQSLHLGCRLPHRPRHPSTG